MANALYDFGRQGVLDGSIAVGSDTIKAALVAATYTPNLAADEFLSDVPSGSIVAESGALTGVTETAGVFRADNTTVSSVTGAVIRYVALYKDTGSPATSRLIALIDTGANLPYTPNGGAITIAWDTGPNGIFRI